MKYARTTGGMLNYIINLEKWCKEDFGYILWMDRGYRTLQNYNIVKQADTIEELCDEFVKIWNDTKVLPELLDFDEEYEYEQEMMKTTYPKGNISIYGAIWTDKGLIYIAKMNDKGELEIL